MGGNDLEWNDDGKIQKHLDFPVSLVETIASNSIKSLALTQSHVIDSKILSDSTRIQHPQRLLQVLLVV